MKFKQSLEDSQADVRKLEAAAAVCSTHLCPHVVQGTSRTPNIMRKFLVATMLCFLMQASHTDWLQTQELMKQLTATCDEELEMLTEELESVKSHRSVMHGVGLSCRMLDCRQTLSILQTTQLYLWA